MPDDKKVVFQELKSILSKFSKGMDVVKDTTKKYELYGKKPVTVGERSVDAMYFASVVVQKNHAAFYFFPIYTHAPKFKDLPPELKKCLKGKSCFHIKKNDKVVFKQVREILKKGKNLYKKDGWV